MNTLIDTTMPGTRRTLLACTLVATLVAGSVPALADPPARARTLADSITVRFADLNVHSAEGARALYGRIRSAAQTVCGPRFSLWDGGHVTAWKQCYRLTIDDAVARINQPLLTNLHQNLGKSSPG